LWNMKKRDLDDIEAGKRGKIFRESGGNKGV
jgi:hypothetical protein